MIQFKPIVLVADVAKSIQDKKVEYVVASKTKLTMFGKISIWKGALENEYFSIVFVNGYLTVSVVEREMLLGKDAIKAAISERLFEMLKDKPDNQVDAAQLEYNQKYSKNDQDEIAFGDIMSFLNWNYADKARVDVDILSSN